MSAHLTAALRCNACDHEWTVEDQHIPPSLNLGPLATWFCHVKCPECQRNTCTVVRMRFCSVAKPEKDAG